MTAEARPQHESQPSTVPGLPPRVDIERFRADLREGGVEELVDVLLGTFVEDCPKRFAALEQAVREGNAKTVQSAAHAFKSGAGTIRATFLADGLAAVEAAARTDHLEQATQLLEQIRIEHLAVLRELEAVLQP
jgi:HPt (histidine-containing phosphotransfer) domain-containing protein